MSTPKPIEILVTGYGSFDGAEDNPSYHVVASLPSHVELKDGRTARLQIYPTPIEVAYQPVRKLVPELYRQYPNVTHFIHVGVHEWATKYQIEKRARKAGYDRKDVKGQPFHDFDRKDFPDELFTRLDVQSLAKGAAADVKGAEVGVSDDAGLFLCEFIFYNSLLHSAKLDHEEGRKIDGLFFHVPMGTEKEDINRGRDLLLSIIRRIDG